MSRSNRPNLFQLPRTQVTKWVSSWFMSQYTRAPSALPNSSEALVRKRFAYNSPGHSIIQSLKQEQTNDWLEPSMGFVSLVEHLTQRKRTPHLDGRYLPDLPQPCWEFFCFGSSLIATPNQHWRSTRWTSKLSLWSHSNAGWCIKVMQQ